MTDASTLVTPYNIGISKFPKKLEELVTTKVNLTMSH